VVDILVYGLDEDDHREIQARRANVYALLDLLREANLVHVLAHPLFDLGGTLGRAQIEKRMVLFPIWEWINGARPPDQNRLAARIAAGADRPTLRQLASRHGLRQPDHRRISGTGGSDDHGGVSVGRAWTRLPRVESTTELLEAMRAGEIVPEGESGSAESLAHTAFAIAARAIGEQAEPSTAGEPLSMLHEYLPILPALSASQIRQILASRYEARLAQSFPANGGGFQAVQTLASVGRLLEGHLLIAPYVGIHGYFGREGRKTVALAREFGLLSGPLRVGIAVDDLDEIHGVATMYRNLERLAAGYDGASIALLRCGGSETRDAATAHLRAVAELPLPLYPGRILGVPSLPDVLDHLAAADYDVVVVATPGPLGLATLFAATTLGIPVIGAYHTEYSAYARSLSGDHLLGDLVEALIREFYRRCSLIAASSRATAHALRERGFASDVAVLRNGVDSALFSPERRDEARRAMLGQGRHLLLYVGRVSREKELAWLAAGYGALRARRDDVHLVVVGDGPYREEMEASLGDGATFTGFLGGEELASTIASCDLFLFPSTTDTLGRAVMEAQSCGVPAVIRDAGGAAECIDPGASGFAIPADDEHGFWSAVESLIDDERRRSEMGYAARRFAAERTWDDVLEGFIGLCRSAAGREAGTPDSVGERTTAAV
jgi:glycosyltransferase involved in cell wall biosynthesis